jgi:hypothetical protein
MFWRREKSLAPAGIRTLNHPSHSLVTIPTILSWLHDVLGTAILKCILHNIQKYGMDSMDSGKGPGVGSCEHGKESSGKTFLHHLNNYLTLRKNSASWR